MSTKHYKLGLIAFLGAVLIFLPLFILATDDWSAMTPLQTLIERGGFKALFIWQFLHFLLGCGLALLAAPTGERSLYFILFLIFSFIVILFNLHLFYGWGFGIFASFPSVLGLLNLVWGFLSVMFTRCYTVRITAKRSY